MRDLHRRRVDASRASIVAELIGAGGTPAFLEVCFPYAHRTRAGGTPAFLVASLDGMIGLLEARIHGLEIMLIVTTPAIEGRKVVEYLGLVSGDAILGANVFRDLFAGIRDLVGGRSGAYEEELRKAKQIALDEMEEQAHAAGADAILAVDLDYETISFGSSNMLMVTATGTAVKLSPG